MKQLPPQLASAIAEAAIAVHAFDHDAPAASPAAVRTPDEARAELQRQGISISEWAVANGFSVPIVFEVLRGQRKCIRGQSHRIAVALGLKEGAICANPATALERRAA